MHELRLTASGVAAFTSVVMACGSPAGSLLGGSGSDNGGLGAGGGSASAVGTTGTGGAGGGSGGSGAGGHGGDAGPTVPTAEALFNTLEPPLMSNCGSCHATVTSLNAPQWLAGPNRYATVKAYPGIIVPDPENSLLLTIGDTVQHTGGPGLPDNPPVNLRDQVANWLEAEAASIEAVPLASTAPFALTNGTMTVDLTKAGMAGATMSFTVALEQATVMFTNISFTAPASTGYEINHPIFAITTGTGADAGAPMGDVSDSFSNLDEKIPPGQTMPFGVGILVLDVYSTIEANWSSADKIVIQFTTVSKLAATDGGADASLTSCKALSTFVADAVPAIQANKCLTCHQGENTTATASMDLTMLGTDNAVACTQALTQVNLTTPSMSNIILAPTGGIAAHPFKGASANFKTMMLDWINAE